jgi:hypothetical protein
MDKKKTDPQKSPDVVRFLCQSAITSPEHEYSREFGRGAIADLTEEIWPGRFLADEVRPGTFERVDAADSPPVLELQVDDDTSEE